MHRLLVHSLIGLSLVVSVPVAAQSTGTAFRDDFDGSRLEAGWTFTDHFADAYPAATADHVSLSMTGSEVSMSFLGGTEHNQWWIEHAQITRPFLGAGVYEMRMDTGVAGNAQFGIVFQGEDPATFMMFMMYGNGNVLGYIERFAYIDGSIYRHTIPGNFSPEIPSPSDGPYYMRVTVRDDVPTQRIWKFEYSLDGTTWHLSREQVLEGFGLDENIGTIAEVGLFVGNHPSDFTAFDGRFAYFDYKPIDEFPPPSPTNLIALAGDGAVELVWKAVSDAEGYKVYRDHGAGLTLLTTTTDIAHLDTSALNGTEYVYSVTAFQGELESLPATVIAQPQVAAPPVDPPDDLPVEGLLLWLDADTALSETGAGNPATLWRDGSGWANDAFANATIAPTAVTGAINGRPALQFDGVDDHLRLPAGFEDFRDGMTVFIVAQPTVLQKSFKLMALGNGAGSDMVVLGRNGGTAGLQYFTSDIDGYVNWFGTADALATGQAGLISVRQSAGVENGIAQASVFTNGEWVGGGDVYVPPVITRSENLIGKSFWDEGMFEGRLAEILMYERELTDAEAVIVQGYLDEKYGLGIDPSNPPPDPDPDPTVLNPPANLAATTANSSVSLSWDAVAGATGYRLWRSEDGGGTFNAYYEISGTSYVDTDLVNGQAYTYVVTAFDATTESADSSPVTATPFASNPAPPSPGELPTAGLVLLLDAEVAIADFGAGAEVTSWQDRSGAGSHAEAFPDEAPVVVANAINGRPAMSFDGVDDYFRLPSGPEDFRSGLTLYVVARPTALQTGFKLLALGNGAGNDMIVLGRAGASAGLQYFTSDESGTVGWFNTGSGLTAGDVALYSVQQGGGASGDPVTAVIERDLDVVGSGTVVVPTVTARTGSLIGRSFWYEGMFEGQLAEVVLYDRTLTDAERAEVETYLDAKYSLGLLDSVPPDPDPVPPDAPAQLDAVAGEAQVTLFWSAVTGVDGYRLWRADDYSGFALIYEGAATSFDDAPLTNGETFYYVVTAYDSVGESADSPQAIAIPLATEPPDPDPDPDPPAAELPTAGLRLLLDAGSAAADFGVGAPVTSWRDQSPYGSDAWSGAGTAPMVVADSIGGQPALRFDGIDDHFNLPTGFEDFTAGISLFVVMRPTVLQEGFKILALGNGAGQDMLVLGRAGSQNGLQYFTNNAAGNVTWFNSAPVLTDGAASLFAVEHEGSTARIFHNGVIITESPVDLPGVAPRSVNYIGQSYWYEGYLQGDLAEIILYDRLLTDAERWSVEAYLDAKYSLGMGTPP